MIEDNFKFNKNNYLLLFPDSPIIFETLYSKPGAKNKKMKEENSFKTINYLLIDDIISIFKRGIKNNNGPNKNHIKKWQYFLDNDIQKYLDNQNET